MTRLRQGRTSFVIAQRLSTIRNADTIIVMDAGLTVEQGSHADLLRRRGCCYSLCNSQSSEALAQAAKLAALSMCSGMAGVERSLGGGAVVRLRLPVPLVYAR